MEFWAGAHLGVVRDRDAMGFARAHAGLQMFNLVFSFDLSISATFFTQYRKTYQ